MRRSVVASHARGDIGAATLLSRPNAQTCDPQKSQPATPAEGIEHLAKLTVST